MDNKKRTTSKKKNREVDSIASYEKLLADLGLSAEEAKNLYSAPPPVEVPQPAAKKNNIDGVALRLFKKYFRCKSKVYFCHLICIPSN